MIVIKLLLSFDKKTKEHQVHELNWRDFFESLVSVKKEKKYSMFEKLFSDFNH